MTIPGVDGAVQDNDAAVQQIDAPQIDVQQNDATQIDYRQQPADDQQHDVPQLDVDQHHNVPQINDDHVHIPGVDYDTPQRDAPTPVTVERVTQADTIDSTHPHQVPALRRSARTRNQPRAYIPSTSGSKYSYAVTQLHSDGVLSPDALMYVQEDFYQAEPDIVAAVTTQLSLRNGLKEWGDKAYEAVESEMNS
jgi:hypothetical protein